MNPQRWLWGTAAASITILGGLATGQLLLTVIPAACFFTHAVSDEMSGLSAAVLLCVVIAITSLRQNDFAPVLIAVVTFVAAELSHAGRGVARDHPLAAHSVRLTISVGAGCALGAGAVALLDLPLWVSIAALAALVGVALTLAAAATAPGDDNSSAGVA